MSCLSKLNRSRLAAIKCGISSTAARAVYLAGANRGALLCGTMSGAAAALGKAWLDKRHYRRQAIASAAYTRLLDGVGQLAMQAASARNPQLRQGIMNLAAARLSAIESADYAGLTGALRQRFRQQHQVVAGWLDQVAAAETERGPTRAFVLGAAQAGKFGTKSFVTPAPPPPSPQTAVQVGIAVGIVAAGLHQATGRLAAGRQQASKAAVPTRRPGPAAARGTSPQGIQLQPVKHSTMVSAAGYNPAARILALTFKSSHKTYLYHDVPAAVAKEFLESDKKGRFFHQQIRGRYRAARLDVKAVSCGHNGLKAALGAVRSGIGRISSKAVFYSVMGLTLGGAAGLLLRRVPGRASAVSPNTAPISLLTLSGPETVLPLQPAEVAGSVCATCGSSGDSKQGSWYRLGGSRYCQDCAPRQAKQTGVVLSAIPAVRPAPTLSALAAYWPRRATTLEPVTVTSGPVSNLAGYAVLTGGKQSGLSLMPEVRTDQEQVRIDDTRWFVNYDRANKPLAGPFQDLKQAQTAASLLCNFNWNRAETEFSAAEVASLKAMLVDFRKQQPQTKRG